VALRSSARAMKQTRSMASKIVYTKCDEAPALATYSLLPIIRKYVEGSGIEVDLADISVAGRIIAAFPDNLTEAQKQRDELSELGELAKTPECNIIKLPNVSASIPQLVAAIAELQAHGYDIPDYPAEPSTPAEVEINARYSKILGSAVNPVLREGNSDRRVAGPVKKFAQNNPHKLGKWSGDSLCHVAHMSGSDFFSSEQSHTADAATSLSINFTGADGSSTVLKEGIAVQAGEVVDSSAMDVAALREFFEAEMNDAHAKGVLFSLHLKATMMKVSDPIMFGHCVEVFYKDAFTKHGALFKELGITANNGVGDVYAKIAGHPKQAEVEADLAACYEGRPDLAMVDSGRGITNLHVPSDVIIDASMPNVVRDSGMMWNKGDELQTCKAVIPDRCYAGIYKQIVNYCIKNGAFDVSTMGNVANVGLMAQKAEEYGSHPNTFELPQAGTVTVKDASGATIMETSVGAGDIWRMCQTKDAPIKDWVKLAVSRAKATGDKAIFWLNPERAHDTQLMAKVNKYLPEFDTTGCDIAILAPEDAIWESMERATAGKNSISCTGNVLRDYLTDLFPIIELGTSAKMLSIVPMLAGGGMYETGAGGSAPKHVQQFVKEGHLRWDSLGEFLAVGVSLEDLGAKGDAKAGLLGKTLTAATGEWLDNAKNPGRKVNTLGNAGSHYYLAMYWAKALAAQTEVPELAAQFGPVAETLAANEKAITDELMAISGTPQDIGGYYQPDDAKASKAMRPSATLNSIIDGI
jgi:isocitrate dehydrogenase